MTVSWGKGWLCGGGVVGSCPDCPKVGGGGGGGSVVGRAAHCTFSPARPGKRVEDPCIYWMNPGPWYRPNDSFWSLDPPVLLLILVVVLVAAIGKGQSTNRHPRAIQYMSVSVLYIPTMGLPILLEEICGPILGLYKSLRPRYSQKRIFFAV